MASRFCTVIAFSFFISTGCNDNGLFGHSKTKEEAKANGSAVIEFVPDKNNFLLLDGTKMHVDTAWTEVSFTYKDGKKIFDTAYGYNFTVPYKRQEYENFSFNLSLVDTTNQMFTNGMGKEACQIRPKYLYDTMKVILEQKNPDTAFGWLKPIITDTIVFTKIR